MGWVVSGCTNPCSSHMYQQQMNPAGGVQIYIGPAGGAGSSNGKLTVHNRTVGPTVVTGAMQVTVHLFCTLCLGNATPK